MEWDSETQNVIKAARYITRLLTGLGAAFQESPGVTIAPATMTNVNVAAYYASGDVAYLNSNGRIETAINFDSTGSFIFTIVAGGTAAEGVMPQIGVTVDGNMRTNFFLTSTSPSTYTISLSLPAGIHTVGLAFLNDVYTPPEDRNAFFSGFTIAAAPLFRILQFHANPTERTAALQWETRPEVEYEIQFTPALARADWQALATVTGRANVSSWEDDGALSGAPPLSSAAPQRFYRIRQVSP